MHIEVGLIAYSGLVVGLFFAVAMVIGAYGLNKALTDDMRGYRDRSPQRSANSASHVSSNSIRESGDWRKAA